MNNKISSCISLNEIRYTYTAKFTNYILTYIIFYNIIFKNYLCKSIHFIFLQKLLEQNESKKKTLNRKSKLINFLNKLISSNY